MAAPSTATQAGRTPAGNATAVAALAVFVADPEDLAALEVPDCFVDAGVVGEVGPVAPVDAGPVVLTPGDDPVVEGGVPPPLLMQVSPTPVMMLNGALLWLAPVLSLIWKIKDWPRVPLTTQVIGEVFCWPKSRKGVVEIGLFWMETK